MKRQYCDCGWQFTFQWSVKVTCPQCKSIVQLDSDIKQETRVEPKPTTPCKPCKAKEETMECPHMTYEGFCNVTSIQTEPTQETCRACKSLGVGINQVTVLYAIETLDKKGESIPEFLQPYVLKGRHDLPSFAPLDLSKGPGTLLKQWISWFITKPVDCTCDDRAELMNLWGKKKCKQEIRTILNWLRESALDNNVRYSEFVVSTIVKAAIILSRGKP